MDKWKEQRLEEIIDVHHGFAFPGALFSDDPTLPVVVTPGNFAIGGGFKQSKSKTFSGEVPECFILNPGDLIISMTDLSKTGDTLGAPALVPNGSIYLHNQRIGLVVRKEQDQVDTRFLNYFLRTHSYRAHILGSASGSTVRHTSPTRIGQYRAMLPPLPEQRAIAEVLGALDDKIAANTKLTQTGHDLALRTYQQGTCHAPMVPMSAVLDPILGGTPARSNAEYWDGDHPWASAKDVTNADFGSLISTEEAISQLAVHITKAKPVQKGSVILTARGTVGAVARVLQPTSFNQSCYAFIPVVLPPGLLYFAVLAATIRAKEMAHGSVFDTITKRTFDSLLVPDLTVSSLDGLEDQVSSLLDLVAASVLENATIARTRDALLPQLMSGKLRVHDAERLIIEVV